MSNRMSLRIGAFQKHKIGALSITRSYLILEPQGTGRGKIVVRQPSGIKKQIGIAL